MRYNRFMNMKDTATIGLSEAYRHTLERMAEIAVADDRTTRFRNEAVVAEWAPRTIATYWGAVCAVMKMMKLQQTPDDVAIERQIQSLLAQAPTWDLEDAKEFLTNKMIEQLEAAVTTHLSPLTPAYIALQLGQRTGDVLKLATKNILGVPQLGEVKVLLKFVETKTSRATGPYTLAVPGHSKVATLVIQAREAARMKGHTYLFINPSPESTTVTKDVSNTEAAIHDAMKQLTGTKVDLRAFRRTGLSRIAVSGCPLTTLLQISRHASISMLERYLASGTFHGQIHVEVMAALEKAWTTPIPQIW